MCAGLVCIGNHSEITVYMARLPYSNTGFSHSYHLDKSISNFKDVGAIFHFIQLLSKILEAIAPTNIFPQRVSNFKL